MNCPPIAKIFGSLLKFIREIHHFEWKIHDFEWKIHDFEWKIHDLRIPCETQQSRVWQNPAANGVLTMTFEVSQ